MDGRVSVRVAVPVTAPYGHFTMETLPVPVPDCGDLDLSLAATAGSSPTYRAPYSSVFFYMEFAMGVVCRWLPCGRS